MKLPYACPVEIWLQVITFLCTRDVIILSQSCKYLHGVAEHVRKRRQDVDQLLPTFVDDVDGFRRLMQKTGGILVGEIATAVFTGVTREDLNSLDLVLCDANLDSCANTWFSFLKGETIAPRGRLPACSRVDQKVCSR
jgi:hypothetical protein